jgi:flagellar basal body rod protein FlgG
MVRFYWLSLAIVGGIFLTSLAVAWSLAEPVSPEIAGAPTGRKIASFWLPRGDDEYEVAIRDLRGNANLLRTAEPLDLAILGDGYFQLWDDEGVEHYTRRGNFRIDANFNIALRVDNRWIMLIPPITIPPDALSIHVRKDGYVSSKMPGERAELQIGQIQLATFENAKGLQSIGGGLYRATHAAGQMRLVSPEWNGVGSVRQGCLETSSLDIVSTVYLFHKAKNWLEYR